MAVILLVHGAWHGPWCWDDVADRLAGHGHDVHAVALRGHDQQPGRLWHRIRDYVAEVDAMAGSFDEPPVLVGHSMGGLVVQKYLERNRASGGVLMASIPHRGTIRAIARIAVRNPGMLLRSTVTMSLRPFVSTRALARDWFFHADTPDDVVDRCWARLQDESYLAFLDTIAVLPRPSRITVPVLVLGAEHDGFFTAAEVRGTARAYGVEAEIFPGMGHNLMLDDGWRRVADRIDEWITETLPPDGQGLSGRGRGRPYDRSRRRSPR